jgi:hypothetical protein
VVKEWEGIIIMHYHYEKAAVFVRADVGPFGEGKALNFGESMRFVTSSSVIR